MPNGDDALTAERIGRAEAAKLATEKDDYCSFGRATSRALLVQFVRAQREGKVQWNGDEGCFDATLKVCITVPGTEKREYAARGNCVKVCINGDCVWIC